MHRLITRIKEIYAKEGVAGFYRRMRWQAARYLSNFGQESWLEHHTPKARALHDMRMRVEKFTVRPLISVVLPVYNPNHRFLREAIQSVIDQVYPDWELCIVDDASSDPCIQSILEEYRSRDARIKLVLRSNNGHISRASNCALDIAQGEFVALLDHDDRLAPHALYMVVESMQADPQVDLLYSNEDKIDESSRRMEPTFKAAWSPEYFLSFMYIGHLAVYRRTLIEKVGRFRAGYEGSQDYDLALRVTEITDRVRHIPQILYHWRKHMDSVALNLHAKPYAFKAAKKALKDAMQRRGLRAQVKDTAVLGVYNTSVVLDNAPAVQVLVYGHRGDNIDPTLLELKSRTHYERIDYIVGVCGSGACPELTAFLRQNLSAVTADFVLLYHSRLLPRNADWLEHLVQFGIRPGIGATGAKILAPDLSCLHAGYTLMEGKLAHNGYGCSVDDTGYAARLVATHNTSVVSSLCMLIRRQNLLEMLATHPDYQSQAAFETALCLELRYRDMRVVWTPHAQLVLNGSRFDKYQDLRDFPKDWRELEQRFAISRFTDPYYPIGLDRTTLDFRFKPEVACAEHVL